MDRIYPIPRDKILALCKSSFEDYGLAPSTISAYMCYMKHVSNYMDDNNIDFYTIEFGEAFIELAVKTDPTSSKKRSKSYQNALSLLNRAVKGEPYTQKRKDRCKVPYPDNELGRLGKDFVESVRNRHLKHSTFEKYERSIREFTSQMFAEGCSTLSDLSRERILEFVTSRTTSDHWWYTTVHKFIIYLDGMYSLPSQIITALDGKRKKLNKTLPSFYTKEEVSKIESSYDRDTKLGKRNYAMAMLASRLGLRASDVCALKLDDLDWKNSRICIEQVKTGKRLDLPLLGDVGDAIIDYLKYARRKTNIRNVFVSMIGPCRPVSVATFSDSVQKSVKRAGIETVGRHTGPHSLRHSLATAMMKSETRIQVISEALGHSGTESTMHYLNINIDDLMECTQEVPVVPQSFYTQKGGAFYV